jgi:hypothetical protein
MRKILIASPDKSTKLTTQPEQLVVLEAAIPAVKESPKPEKATPPKTFVRNDGRYVLLDPIPTSYRFYAFKQLWIRPFSTSEAKLIYMAKKSGNLTYLISAVAACLSEDVFSLKIQDFEYCLYWLRLNSYPKKPFKVEWTCDNVPAFLTSGLVSAEEPVPNEEGAECGYKNLSTLGMTSLIIDTFPDEISAPETIDLPSMSLFEDVWSVNQRLSECRKQILNGTSTLTEEEIMDIEGAAYIVGLAQWIKDGETLKDKIYILEGQPDFTLQDGIEELLSELTDFGVAEYVNVTCQKCGGTSRRKLVLDYISFFP